METWEHESGPETKERCLVMVLEAGFKNQPQATACSSKHGGRWTNVPWRARRASDRGSETDGRRETHNLPPYTGVRETNDWTNPNGSLKANWTHFGWGLLRMLSAPVSFLHSKVYSHLAQALATSMLSATKNRCGMGFRVEPLLCFFSIFSCCLDEKGKS